MDRRGTGSADSGPGNEGAEAFTTFGAVRGSSAEWAAGTSEDGGTRQSVGRARALFCREGDAITRFEGITWAYEDRPTDKAQADCTRSPRSDFVSKDLKALEDIWAECGDDGDI